MLIVVTMLSQRGITLIELLIVIAIIGILALIGVPEINRFIADSKVRSCATDLIQNMRLARAMAIKENREYLIVFDTANQRYMMGFDGDSDKNLITLNFDTFGICKDNDGDRLPNNDSDSNGDGVPDCVKVVNLRDYGNNIQFGTLAEKDPNGETIECNGKTVCFGNTTNPIRAEFNPNGSAGNTGSAYFQHTGRGYSYVVRISHFAGTTNVWKWDGDKDNQGVTTWKELR